jgi:hypothetical protein
MIDDFRKKKEIYTDFSLTLYRISKFPRGTTEVNPREKINFIEATLDKLAASKNL